MARSERETPAVNAGSMADIAFLLLIFFLVTTQIASDKGLLVKLPPKPDPDQEDTKLKLKDRNLFKVLINSQDKLLVEDEPLGDVRELKGMVKNFVMNPSNSPDQAESLTKAIVSIKSSRGTTYSMYIKVRDQIESAYNEMYGEKVGLTADQFRDLDLDDPEENELYERARMVTYDANGKKIVGFPKQVSVAQPNK